MKNYRNAAAALMLAFVLSTAAYGDGIMHTDKATPTPTPAVNGIMHTDATQCITHTDAAESVSGLTDAVTVVALSVLQSVLTLF